MSGQIFISYRREDSSASAGRLFDILRNHFAANQIFMDEKEERLDAERREERTPRVLKKATKEQPWQNSLGMKFVPVAGTQVLFNIWDTRLEDFHARPCSFLFAFLGFGPAALRCPGRRERTIRE